MTRIELLGWIIVIIAGITNTVINAIKARRIKDIQINMQYIADRVDAMYQQKK